MIDFAVKDCPWLESAMTRFSALSRQQTLGQSMLLEGVAGLGLNELAAHMAQSLLESETNEHPDIFTLKLEEKSNQIKIGQIRALTDFLALKAFKGPYKVGIIQDAHTMNINAQNALLKTLEEPPEMTVLILVSNQKGRLLPTIMSRCQVWQVTADEASVDAFLSSRFQGQDLNMLKRICALGPLAMPDLNEVNKLVQGVLGQNSPIALAETMKDLDTKVVLDILLRLIVDALLVQTDLKPLTFLAYEAAVKTLPKRGLKSAERKCLNAKDAIKKGVNLNTQLLLEDILIDLVAEN